jgi:hemolysin III
VETTYCRKEEAANAATHAAGLVCALAGAAAVVAAAIRQGQAWEIAGCVIYAVTLVAVYAGSTLSHLFHKPSLRHALRIADQAIIYLFIAGTFTPIAFTWLRHGLWWICLAAMWTVALIGFTRKAIFAHHVEMGTVSTVLYLVLGWMPVVVIWPLAQIIPVGLTAWVIVGGLCYTFGIVFFHYDKHVRYFHAAWHMMVIAGSVCHYLGVFFYCTKPATG